MILAAAVTVAPAANAGTPRRSFSDDEIGQLWERRPTRSAAHRGYIYIDEEDIVEGTELPLYRVEASRYVPLRQLERMARGDPGIRARMADLDPALARETVIRSRADAAFYDRRPGVARDVPQTPDLLGPLLQFVRLRR